MPDDGLSEFEKLLTKTDSRNAHNCLNSLNDLFMFVSLMIGGDSI